MTKTLKDVTLSVLDLAPVLQGGTAKETFQRTVDLAQYAEELGYYRYWMAEHHNMPGIASSATAVLIGHVAGATNKIRVGSGGIMLPNHAPLVIAEQFGTLESLYPGRIDLGLGRAPGTDYQTSRALRRDEKGGAEFEGMVQELRSYFQPFNGVNVRAVPGEGLDIPIWLLGSSGFSARLAGELGLPFAFASHFAPENTLPALDIYRSSFTPSTVLDKPYVIVGANVIAADTDDEAKWLSTSQQQQFLELTRGTPGPLKPPIESLDSICMPHEKAAVERQLASSIVGSSETVKGRLEEFVLNTEADEVIVHSQIYDHHKRLKSFKIVKGVHEQ
ncbi:LLM class flavin-dependent oxidoreductase [Alteribacter aurantiacus]|uniref:LLM class flavin-dependent oxidoreductase n=1 Tax=Alteribacter aurantiacus TaxID=254410 RepID=UPI00040AA846|nr:LLM class flavin-dependent oxidoreductase [Alteribacter aurantiacus]